MRSLIARDSIARRVIVALVVGEVLLAVVLRATLGAFGLLSAARQRSDALEEVSSIVAAGLMPIIADQRKEYMDAQLSSILATAEVRSVEGVRITDSSGATIASAGKVDSTEGRNRPGSLLWGSPVVSRALHVDGLETVTVDVQFAPVGPWELLQAPILSSSLLLFAFVLVSVPWTVWRVTEELVVPLTELQDNMPHIIAGDADLERSAQGPGELRELEESLLAMASQVRDRDERLRASYEELTVAYESLDEAKRHIEGLAAVAAHEIRTPLALIGLQAEVLQSGEITQLDEAGFTAVAKIRSACSRLTTIVSDLMDAALLERGLIPISFADLWLDELLEEAIADANALAASTGVTVAADDAFPELFLRGDRVRLRQVIDNLLSNAVKHSPPSAEVTVRARERDEWVTVEVVDRGRGIAGDNTDRLFTLFGRLDQSDGRQTPGLGLGLAISKQVVEAHGGTITFRANEEGQGSIFVVTLPRSGPAEAGSSLAAMVG